MNRNNQINSLLLHRNNNIPQLNQSNFCKFKNIIITNIIIIFLLSSSLIFYYFQKIKILSSKNIIHMLNKDLLTIKNYKNYIYPQSDSNTNFIPLKSNKLKLDDVDYIDDDVNLLDAPTFYQITIEKILYEKQKQNIMSNLVTNGFDGKWESISDTDTNISSLINNYNGGSVIFEFDKAFERRSREEALALFIQLNEGQYIDNWIKFSSYCMYQSLNKKVNILDQTFEISGNFLTELENGEIFDASYKKEDKFATTINMIFPLSVDNISLATIRGDIVYSGKIYTINPKNFTLFMNSTVGFSFKLEGRMYDKKEEEIKKDNKIKMYFCMVIISSILYISAIFIVIYGIKKSEMRISALNVECIVFISLWNFYCFVTNIYLTFKAFIDYFISFFIIGSISLIKLLFFDTWLFYIFWTIKNRNITDQSQLTKLNLRFYILYFLLLIIIFFLVGLLFFNYLCITLNCVILWLILIVHNIVTNNRYGLPLFFTFACSIERIIYPLYFRGIDNNFFMLKTSKFFILVIIIFFIISVICLLAQSIIGPRFMLPKKYQKVPYDFYKNLDELEDSFKDINNEECVICLVPILDDEKSDNKLYEMNEFNSSEESDKEDENNINNETKENDSIDNSKETKDDSKNNVNINDNNNSDDNNLLINDEIKNNNNKKEKDNSKNINDQKDEVFNVKKNNFKIPSILKTIMIKIYLILKICIKENFLYFYKPSSNTYNKLYMVTPCNHIFHSECLEKWLELKKECPNCRTSLESLI